MSKALEALTKISYDFAVVPQDMWSDNARPHVDGINSGALAAVQEKIQETAQSRTNSPTGLVITGEPGTGKSHFLGVSRREVQDAGGFLVALTFDRTREFWGSMAASIRKCLERPHRLASSGIEFLLTKLADRAEVSQDVRDELLVKRKPTQEGLDHFVQQVVALDWESREARHTLRALLLYFAHDQMASEVGEQYLKQQCPKEIRYFVRVLPATRTAQETVSDLSLIMSLVGPTLVTLDQVDKSLERAPDGVNVTDEMREYSIHLLESLGNGLVDLRDHTRRTAIVLSVLPEVWDRLQNEVTASIADRFQYPPVQLQRALPSATVATQLVAALLAPYYRQAGFTPDYPSYPFSSTCFDAAARFTPRELLKGVANWIRKCRQGNQVVECTAIPDRDDYDIPPTVAIADAEVPELRDLDERFAHRQASVDTGPAFNPDTEHTVIPVWLEAAFNAWKIENGHLDWEVRRDGGRRSRVFATLTRTDSETELTRYWSIRSHSSHHGVRVGKVLEKLLEQKESDNPFKQGHIGLWVTAPQERWGTWGAGTQVRATYEEFSRCGHIHMADPNDIRVFAALYELSRERPRFWEDWLASRKPASNSTLMSEIFGNPNPSIGTPPPRPNVDAVSSTDSPITVPEQRLGDDALSGEHTGDPGGNATSDDETAVSVAPAYDIDHSDERMIFGRNELGEPIGVEFAALAKHTAVFAGSGSGKTVLLKRIVETCATQGISSIVLDPNNDLSRLGQPWPEPPSYWGPAEHRFAQQYFADADVVVWTPGRTSGRHISFQPLPDLRSVASSEDDFAIALDSVVASLAPRARITGETAKAERQRAILRETIQSFVLSGGWRFTDFLEYLGDLPEEASGFSEARSVASDIAGTLQAVRVNDRMFANSAESVDPSVLLTPREGKKARVSVINFMGLPDEGQRQSFVNQLQMTLFPWLKENPTQGAALGHMLLMDEAQTFAPSGSQTASTRSTLTLASQARKFGMGMVFATQAPKGLHNQAVGNCSTHLYGRLTADAQVAAAKAIAENVNGSRIEPAALSAGEFYFVAAGEETNLVRAPMCVSHHPPTAPSQQEIYEFAAASKVEV